MDRNRVKKFGFPLFIAALIILNAIVIDSLISSNQPLRDAFNFNIPPPRIGMILDAELLSLNDGIRITSDPLTNINLFYVAANSPIIMGELGYLKMLAKSALSPSLNIIVLYIDKNRSYRNISNFIETDMAVINCSSGVLDSSRTIYPVPGYLIATKNDSIIYEGALRKDLIYPMLMQLLAVENNYIDHGVKIGDSIIGTITSESGTIDLSNNSGTSVVILYSSFCVDCGGDNLYDAAESVLGFKPYAIVSDDHDWPSLMKYLSAWNYNPNIFKIDIDHTNITRDDFLSMYPVVLILNNGKVQFKSNRDMSINYIIEETRKLGRN